MYFRFNETITQPLTYLFYKIFATLHVFEQSVCTKEHGDSTLVSNRQRYSKVVLSFAIYDLY